MSAARKPVAPPDMGSLDASLEQMKRLRQDVPVEDLAPLAEQQESRQEEEQEGRQEEEAARSRPGRSRGGRRPAPAAADAVPTTVRFDPEEASEIDWFVLELRADARRRTLDKSEVIRELLRLAREHPPTKKALLKRLT
ncbi:hypothetical protein OG906_43470 (plasmid) [Streptomyces sp. NBC_01426]|uniref:hypothetical protein n=1 Tax=Streptomyces sp. NBC_01426 TaxID=2975866 RepID=UPI002E31AFAC|nr:hypothetical protein [Streptomyces sp. NBC_01426]